MAGPVEPLFDHLARRLGAGGSRRDFVRRTLGLAAAGTLAGAGVPRPLVARVASAFGLRGACASDKDCTPCETCAYQATGDLTCIYFCADCETCDHSTRQCASKCPPCKTCNKFLGHRGECAEDLSLEARCKSCDPETGEITDLCTACEKCDRGYCASNCSAPCEICDQGSCRKCDRPCEVCDPGGTCHGCDPHCERCDPATETCRSTCPGGFSCCHGECTTCCSGCGKRTQRRCESLDDTCPHGSEAKIGTTTVCCGARCADLWNDVDNCGSCDNRCRHVAGSIGGGVTEETCFEGKCVCGKKTLQVGGVVALGGFVECRQEGHECCFGECLDIARYQTDPEHCGKCIVRCEKDEKCVSGQCVGSKRSGYRLTYRMRQTTANYGVEMDVMLQATVRSLRAPDAEGNTHVGWGTYEGYLKNRKVNCSNDLPMDWETIPLVGRARGTASAEPDGSFVAFVITPLDPPKMHIMTVTFRGFEEMAGLEEKDLPDAILPVLAARQLQGGQAREHSSVELPGDSCGGKRTLTTEWEITRVD